MTAMFGLQLRDRKIAKDLMVMLSLNEAVGKLAVTKSGPRWCIG